MPVPASGAAGASKLAGPGHEKSNRSSSAGELASRAVSAGSPNTVSTKRVIAVWSYSTLETKPLRAQGEITANGTRGPR